jgi:hypothetical protein
VTLPQCMCWQGPLTLGGWQAEDGQQVVGVVTVADAVASPCPSLGPRQVSSPSAQKEDLQQTHGRTVDKTPSHLSMLSKQ